MDTFFCFPMVSANKSFHYTGIKYWKCEFLNVANQKVLLTMMSHFWGTDFI